MARASSGSPESTSFEVNAECTSAPFDKNVEIAASLRCLDDAEAVGMTGNVQISRVVTGDL